MYENANYSYFNGAPIQGMTQQPYGMPMGQFNGVSYGQPQPIKWLLGFTQNSPWMGHIMQTFLFDNSYIVLE